MLRPSLSLRSLLACSGCGRKRDTRGPCFATSHLCSLHKTGVKSALCTQGWARLRIPQDTRSGLCKRREKLRLLKWTIFSWVPESSEGNFGWVDYKCCVASCAGLLQHLQTPRKQQCRTDMAVPTKHSSEILPLPWNHCTALSLWLPIWKTEVMNGYLIVLVKCLLIQGWKIWAKHKVPLILSYFLKHC